MDKVTKFLERHVQWLVLGIALLYVGYTVYAYLVVPPLQIALSPAGKPALPGTVDDEIKTLQADPLDREMNADPKLIKAPAVTDVESVFTDELNMVTVADGNLPNRWDAPSVPPGFEPTHGTGLPGVAPVVALPILPPANFDAMTSRRTVAMAPGRKDMAYTSVRFKIDAAALSAAAATAFQKPGVPPVPVSEFVSVDVYRQEQKPNGTWGDSVKITPLPLYVFEQMPAPNADKKSWFEYKKWIETHQAQIQKPEFFKTAADAEPWVPPGGVPPAMGPGGARPPVGGRPGAGGPPGLFNPAGPPPGGPPLPPPGTPEGVPPGLPPGDAGNPAGPGGPNVLNPGLVQDIPILVHDISVEQGKIYRYAVQYRLYNPFYNNKVFAAAKVAEQFYIESPDPRLDKDPKSVAWSGPATVEPDAYVFVNKIKAFGNPVAEFDIFEWKDGHWHVTSPKSGFTTGDLISGQMGVSHFTLVDVRKDPSKQKEPEYAIIMDANGNLDARTEREDAGSAKRASLKLEAIAGPATAAAR